VTGADSADPYGRRDGRNTTTNVAVLMFVSKRSSRAIPNQRPKTEDYAGVDLLA